MKKNQHPKPKEYRVKYRINGDVGEFTQYYNVFHSSEALDFLAHTFRKNHIEGNQLLVIIVEEYDRFKDAWNDRTEKAIKFAESPEIVINNKEVFLIKDKNGMH